VYSSASDGDLLRQKARRVMNKYLPECLFENLPPNNQHIVRNWAPPMDGDPIVVFRRDDTTWTVLTDRRLISEINNLRSSIALAQIRSDYELRGSERKDDQNLIQFPGCEHWVWSPSAEHASLLLNIMFIVFHRNERPRR
jgi:hypothetical protein